MTRHASLVLWLLLAVSACGVPEEEQINSNQPWFEDVADSAGVDFVHVRAKTSRYWLAEIMSGGAAWLDYDNDGDPDLFLTHLRAETNTLYQNEGGVFEDVTATTGLAAASVAFTGFGTGFADFDNDGHLDLYVGNGRVGRGLPVTSPFSEPNLLFRGLGGIRFKLVNPGGGTANQRIDNTRAVALADYDRDGGVDAVLVNNGGPARLLHNVAGAGRGWLALELRESNGREAIGARVAIVAGGRTQWRTVSRAAGYLTSNSARLHFGIGEETIVTEVIVYWTDGGQTNYGPLQGSAAYSLKRGVSGAVLLASHRR